MRILTINADPELGGSSKSLITLCDGLKAENYKAFVVIPKDGTLSKALGEKGIPCYVNKYLVYNVWPSLKSKRDILFWIPRFIRLILFLFLSIYRMNQIIKETRPDIIHSNSSILTAGFYSAKLNKIPHIWHIREYIDKDFGLIFFPCKSYRKKLLRESPSISITQEINKYYSLEESGITIYNGIYDLNSIKINDENPDRVSFNFKYFLYVGKIAEYKGVTDMMLAYCSYIKAGGKNKLILCGSLENIYKQELQSIIEGNNISVENVIYMGQINDVAEYMKDAEALIVPSFYEAFGRVTAEAMFCNCLIIGRNTGGTKEQLELGVKQTGEEIGLRFNTVEELASRLHLVEYMKCEDRSSYLERAYKTAINNFSLEYYIKSVRNYIDLVIEKRGM